MNIVLTGSLGNIGKLLTQALVHKGHIVTVISSNTDRIKDIESLGAEAAIGTMQDTEFLSATFKGADIVYTMVTLDHRSFFDPNVDMLADIARITENYKLAIETSGVKKIVHLSSVGAHTDKGNGSLLMHFNAENSMNQLPDDVSIKFMRPTGFFTNLFRSLQSIRTKGAIITNYGGDTKEPWVSPMDIAAVITEEMEMPFEGRMVRYIASDEVSPNEIVKVLGEAIGNPDLKWLAIPDEELLNGMLYAGMNPQIANGLVEMQAAQGNGTLYEDFYRNKPFLGKVKLTDFVNEFAIVYHQLV
ncbi:NAD(P)H-binding protein [Dyadobacter sp. 3J3]|uniref:NmrA family NAD(P)-binding protein n=1 Tax=Dyadobacter sp. 3J3 TaxID=2606600 RepID=UPI001357DFD8|nr:NAD(P)H-binding protein [Dyadobacter sp. 3J3]